MKETQKQTIARLENELATQKSLYNKLNVEMLEIQERADKSFLNSGEYIQMNKRIEFIEMQNKQLETKNKSLKDRVHDLINETEKVQNVRNERGAGRKAKFTDQEKETIKMYRLQGKTIKEIAQMYNCSVGLIHKSINE